MQGAFAVGPSRLRGWCKATSVVGASSLTLVLFAYGLFDFQLAGAPAWVSRDRFDITARADGPLSLDEKRTRLRRLLADRFGLRVRNETREQDVYALTRIVP